MEPQPSDSDAARRVCTWCEQPARAWGEDGSLSCGQGQGDGLPPHNHLGVLYTPFTLARPPEELLPPVVVSVPAADDE